MVGSHPAKYLNDHLAGPVIVMEMLEDLEKTHAGASVAAFHLVLVEIAEDRQELEALTGRLEISGSPVRKTTVWLSERLTQAKLKRDDFRKFRSDCWRSSKPFRSESKESDFCGFP